jgi:GT2 family glycosyltransferase
MRQHPEVTTIVLNYNGAHLLPDCLSTLRQQDWPALDVLVVDNGSLDDSPAVVAAHGARWHPLGENLGFSRANNRAAEQARGDFLFFVNNDMRFTPTCVRILAQVLRDDGSLFAVDPTQLNWDGSRIIHGRTRFVPGTFKTTVVPPYGVEYAAPSSGVMEVPWGCAGSLMVRRDRFEALGGFDPTFFIDFEDTDLCWRAWRRGWRTLYVPEAVLYHKVGMSGDEYQYLVRGVAPGRVPKFWFRRRLSYHRNLLRFGLKCLPPRTALQLALHMATRAAWHLTQGNLKIALAIAWAFLGNLRNLPGTWCLRRDVSRTCAWNHQAVLQRFVSLEQGEHP